MFISLIRKLHAWAGLALCLLLVPIALSGTLLVFKPQWLRATVPGADTAAVVTPEIAARAMADAQAAFPGARNVVFAGPEIGVHQVNTASGGGYLSPITGEPIQTWGKNERVVDWLFDFHHHLLSGDTGTTVVGWVGVLTAIMVLTGLVVWAPAWRSFAGHLAPRHPGRAGWLAAHRDIGVIAAPVVLLMALTGSAMALDDLAARLMGFERPKPPVATAGAVDWPSALALAQARFPDATLRIANWPREPGRPATVRLKQPGEWHNNGRTLVHIDPASGRVLAVEDAMTRPTAARLYATFWPLHASKVGGLAWKAVTFAGGLALAALAAYGAESYRRKLFPVGRRQTPATA